MPSLCYAELETPAISSSLLSFYPLKLLFYLLLPLLLLTHLWVYHSRKKNGSRSYENLPPYPPKLPLIGNLHQLLLSNQPPYRFLESYSKQYGDVMLMWIVSVPCLIISSAEAAGCVMKTHDASFADRPYMRLFDMLFYNCRDIVSAPYGEYWRQVKGISVLHLLSNSRVKSYHKVRCEEVSLMLEKISVSTSTQVINLTDMLMTLANDVVCRVAFGRKHGSGEGKTNFSTAILGEMSDLLGGFYLGEFIPWLSWIHRLTGVEARVERVRKELDELMEGIIHEHQQRVGGRYIMDLVDVLLEVQRNEPNGLLAEMECIKAIILDVLFAGTDTTFSVLEWTMSELLKNPNIMRAVLDEVRGITLHKGKNINSEDLEKMVYLRAVIKESMRLHPPVPLPVPHRSSTQCINSVKGFDIPKGTRVITNVWAIQRDPAYWNQPEEFRPERFLDLKVDYRGQDFELIPFGAGRRICPGISFAVEIIELTLASLVRTFDWTLPEGSSLDMSETSSSIIMHRKNPLLVLASEVKV